MCTRLQSYAPQGKRNPAAERPDEIHACGVDDICTCGADDIRADGADLIPDTITELGGVIFKGNIVSNIAAFANLLFCFAGVGLYGAVMDEKPGDAAVVQGEKIVFAGHSGH